MESRIKLVQYAISKIEGKSFTLYLSMDDGNWEGLSSVVDISAAQLKYLLKDKIGKPELFNGIEVEEIDLDSIAAKECKRLYCDGWVFERINTIESKELISLRNRISEFADNYVAYKGKYIIKAEGADECNEILDALNALEAGRYKFGAYLIDQNGYVPLEKNVTFRIDAQLARDIVLNCSKTQLDKVDQFKGLVEDTAVTSGKLVDIMNSQGISLVNYLDYAWSSYDLDTTLDAWTGLVIYILEGNVTQSNIDKCIDYLEDDDDLEYWESDIEELPNVSEEDSVD